MIRQILKKLVRTNKFFGALYDIYLNIKLKKIIKTKNKKFSESGIETFQDLCKLLNERNIKFWLCYGTLLGYVRENGILKHDFDFDIGLWNDDYSKELESALEAHGFKLMHQFKSITDYPAFEQTYEKNGVSIDFFYHYANEDKIWTNVFYREKFEDNLEKGLFRIRKLDYPKAELQKVTFLNTSVFIPSNAEEYLAEIYGDNWRIPDPNYDWHNGPKNNCTVSDAYGIMENTIQITRGGVLRNNFSIMRPSFMEAA